MGIEDILTGDMTESQYKEEYLEWKAANSQIKGNVRMSLKSGGHAHIASVKGAYNIIRALKGAYKFKRYKSRKVL